MTSISAATSSSYTPPLQKQQLELQLESYAGSVGSSNQSSQSLTNFDPSRSRDRQYSPDSQALNAGQTDDKPPSLDDIKSKVNNLISGQVNDGKLTGEQAANLQNQFANTFDGSTKGGSQSAGGLPPGGAPASRDASATNNSASSNDSTSPDYNSLKSFLKKLQQDSQSAASSYSANGTTTAYSGSLLIDFKT